MGCMLAGLSGLSWRIAFRRIGRCRASRCEGAVISRAAHSIVGDARPICFHVARVSFTFAGEAYDLR